MLIGSPYDFASYLLVHMVLVHSIRAMNVIELSGCQRIHTNQIKSNVIVNHGQLQYWKGARQADRFTDGPRRNTTHTSL